MNSRRLISTVISSIHYGTGRVPECSRAGRTLGHCEILEKLGEGGMGVVYKARDPRLDRFIACKILPAGKLAEPSRRQRFVQEARAASALNHPNIITIHEIASEDGVDFIVMEFVAGRTLDRLIPKGGMRLGEALTIAIQIAGALSAAHAAGIVHRDLKPGNVMVTDSGLVKVLDFGLAKLAEPSAAAASDETRTLATQEGAILGTVAYMAPEQAEGRAVDGRSDIFAFGSVMYEMITGRRAFTGDSTASTLSAVLRDDPAAPGSVVQDLPREVERIVVRCLRKDPARRFQTAGDLKVALEDLRQELESGILSSGAVPKPQLAVRRGVPWPVVIGLCALVVVASLAALFNSRSAPEPTLTSVPLTSYPGMIGSPSFSPDGNQVAFSWGGEQNTNDDIYIKLVGPGAPLRVTSDPRPDRAPAWSPDGRWIAFVRALSESGQTMIVLIPALGGAERPLAEGIFMPFLAWTPDGRWIISSRRDQPQTPAFIIAVSVESGEVRRLIPPLANALTGDFGPAVSPDGARVRISLGSDLTATAISRPLSPLSTMFTVRTENRSVRKGHGKVIGGSLSAPHRRENVGKSVKKTTL